MPDVPNLLPANRARAVRQLYWLRRATVAALLLAGVAFLHGIFLVPAYFALAEGARERGGEEGRSENALRAERIKDDAAYLALLEGRAKAAPSLASLLEAPSAGVRVARAAFLHDGSGARVEIAGTAATREDLRAYERALESLPSVSSVEVPVGAYAEERDIAFSLTVSGPLLP